MKNICKFMALGILALLPMFVFAKTVYLISPIAFDDEPVENISVDYDIINVGTNGDKDVVVSSLTKQKFQVIGAMKGIISIEAPTDSYYKVQIKVKSLTFNNKVERTSTTYSLADASCSLLVGNADGNGGALVFNKVNNYIMCTETHIAGM